MRARPAAVLLAGLLVFDPSLKLMVVTKENVAAHAFAALGRFAIVTRSATAHGSSGWVLRATKKRIRHTAGHSG